jgi:hypothetical protein
MTARTAARLATAMDIRQTPAPADHVENLGNRGGVPNSTPAARRTRDPEERTALTITREAFT